MGSIGYDVIAECSNVQRIFVRGIGFGFGNGLRRADEFLYFVIVFVVVFVGIMLVAVPFAGFCGAFVFFVEVRLVVFVLFDFGFRALFGFFFVVFFGFVLFEDGAAGSRVRVDLFAHQILFGFNNAGGEDGGFFLTDIHFFAIAVHFNGLAVIGSFLFGSGSDVAARIFISGSFRGLFGAFGRSAGKQPTGQTAARTAWSIDRGRLTSNAWLRFIWFRLRFEAFGFGYRSSSLGYRAPAIFRQRFTRQHKRLFRGIGRSGGAWGIRAAIKVTTRSAIVAAAV